MRSRFHSSDTVLASLLVAALLLVVGGGGTAAAQEVLPSWKDTAAKTRIMDFVKATLAEGVEGYVAPEDRIAV
ncbi:haloacid dehalogenase-like hydrolase, partial [Rhizobium leguminosarum]